MTLKQNDRANPVLYRLYYSIIMRDILYKLGFDSTKQNKEILHDFHKRVLKYKSIAGLSHEGMSLFINRVLLYWAEKGLFIRNKQGQPINIQDMDLQQAWELL